MGRLLFALFSVLRAGRPQDVAARPVGQQGVQGRADRGHLSADPAAERFVVAQGLGSDAADGGLRPGDQFVEFGVAVDVEVVEAAEELGEVGHRRVPEYLGLAVGRVIYRGAELIPGADRFLAALRDRGIPFLLLTNNSQRTRRDVVLKLAHMGVDVDEEHVFTCAMATARFLAWQKPGGSAFVIGEGGLLTALHLNGYAVDERSPDFVVVGEGRTLTYEMVEKALRLILNGAKLIATDAAGQTPKRILLRIWTNAVKFTPPGGRVQVELRTEEAAVRITVADTGQGIRPDAHISNVLASVSSAFKRPASSGAKLLKTPCLSQTHNCSTGINSGT